MQRRVIVRIVMFLIAWVAFAWVGLIIHETAIKCTPNRHHFVDVSGYDSELYASIYSYPQGMFLVTPRHPLVTAVISPIIAVGMTVNQRCGKKAAERAVIVCFAGLGALSCLLLWLLVCKVGADWPSRLASMGLWLSFAFVWITGSIADSFIVSECILVGTLLLVAHRVKDVRIWIGTSLLAGAVTITNLVKPLLAWGTAVEGVKYVRNLPQRTKLLASLACIGAVGLAFLVLSAKWLLIDHIGIGCGIQFVWKDIMEFFPKGETFGDRLWYVWQLFWCEPMLLHGSVIGKEFVTEGYESFVPHLIAGGVLSICVWSAMRNFRLPIVRAALAMVACDVLLHVVIGWGIAEGQVYCAHWFWILPLLASLLPRWTALPVGLLTVSTAIWNISILVR